jgi:hypothetical protein
LLLLLLQAPCCCCFELLLQVLRGQRLYQQSSTSSWACRSCRRITALLLLFVTSRK